MRNLATPILVLALVAAGCSGAYDRELLGEPAPAVSARPTAPPPEEMLAESDTLVGEELIHTPMEYTMFDELDPYGGWYETDDFGTVWRPIMGPGWQPFASGHWIWTSYGWMWVSYEPFGWATYHYGTWWLDPMLGWIWVPGYDWSPCPVDWFYTDGYLGWAPLPPSGYGWDDPWEEQGRYKEGWVVVETGKFREVDVGENRIAPDRFKSAYRTGTAVRRAPDTATIERATRMSVKETNVRIDSRRVGDHELRKVVLPPKEQHIVDRFPTPAPQPVTGLQPPPSGGGSGGGTTVAPPPTSGGGKPKGPSSPPPSNSGPAKVKSKDNSKGSASDSSKAKGGSKDDGKDSGNNGGKSKGDSKDGGGKAKGGKR